MPRTKKPLLIVTTYTVESISPDALAGVTAYGPFRDATECLELIRRFVATEKKEGRPIGGWEPDTFVDARRSIASQLRYHAKSLKRGGEGSTCGGVELIESNGSRYCLDYHPINPVKK